MSLCLDEYVWPTWNASWAHLNLYIDYCRAKSNWQIARGASLT